MTILNLTWFILLIYLVNILVNILHGFRVPYKNVRFFYFQHYKYRIDQRKGIIDEYETLINKINVIEEKKKERKERDNDIKCNNTLDFSDTVEKYTIFKLSVKINIFLLKVNIFSQIFENILLRSEIYTILFTKDRRKIISLIYVYNIKYVITRF